MASLVCSQLSFTDHLENGHIYHGMGWINSADNVTTLKNVYNIITIEGCKKECQNNLSCVAFTFITSKKRCDLKDSNQAVKLKGGFVDGIISGWCQSGTVIYSKLADKTHLDNNMIVKQSRGYSLGHTVNP